MNITQVLRLLFALVVPFVVALFFLVCYKYGSICYRVIEMPYAYQCCVYGSCDSYKPASQWDTEQSNTDEDLHKRTVAMYPIHADTHCKKACNYDICVNIYETRGKVIDGNLSPICSLLNYWQKPTWDMSEPRYNHSYLAAGTHLNLSVDPSTHSCGRHKI